MADDDLTPEQLAALQTHASPSPPPSTWDDFTSWVHDNIPMRPDFAAVDAKDRKDHEKLPEGGDSASGKYEDTSQWKQYATANPQAVGTPGLPVQAGPPAPAAPVPRDPVSMTRDVPPPQPTTAQLASVATGGAGPSKPYDPMTEGAIAKYGELSQGAAEAGIEGRQQAREQQGVAAVDRAAFGSVQQGAFEDSERQRKMDIDASKGHWKRAQDEAAELAKKGIEDPEDHMGFGTRLAMAISMAAGAFGASLGHTQNGAAQIWKDRLERDVAAQKQRISEGRATAEDAKSDFMAELQRTGDERQAELLTQAKGLKAFEQGLQAKLAGEPDPMANAEGQKELKDAQKGIAELGIEFDKVKPKPKEKGAGPAPVTQAKIGEMAEKIRKDAADKGTPMPIDEAMHQARRFLIGEGRQDNEIDYAKAPKSPKQEKADEAKDNLAESLETLPQGYGQDAWDRNAPNFLRSSESLQHQADAVQVARTSIKAFGGREPPPGEGGDQAALHTVFGARPDADAVAAARKRLEHLAGVQGSPAAIPSFRGQ